jgi:hypothetical protein
MPGIYCRLRGFDKIGTKRSLWSFLHIYSPHKNSRPMTRFLVSQSRKVVAARNPVRQSTSANDVGRKYRFLAGRKNN